MAGMRVIVHPVTCVGVVVHPVTGVRVVPVVVRRGCVTVVFVRVVGQL
jgi:hypothetical protein